MSDQKYDSVLVGWADEPRYNDNNELMGWQVRLKDTELQEMIEKYATRRDSEGKGGNVYLTLFMSKSGKACCRVFDPNSRQPRRRRSSRRG